MVVILELHLFSGVCCFRVEVLRLAWVGPFVLCVVMVVHVSACFGLFVCVVCLWFWLACVCRVAVVVKFLCVLWLLC